MKNLGLVVLCGASWLAAAPGLMAQVEVSRGLGGAWPKPGAHETLGRFSGIDLPVQGTMPVAVIVDARHNVWIAEKNGNRVMSYDPWTGDFYPLVNREKNGGIQDLAVDRLGNIWFTQFGVPEEGTKGSALAVVTPGNGNLAEYRTLTPESGPYNLALDPEGFVYATLYYANKILRVDPNTSETIEYEIPTRVNPTRDWEGDSSLPTGIASDQNGIVWFCQSRGNKVGRLDPANGEIREYEIPIQHAGCTGVAIDSRGYPWVTLTEAHQLGRVDPRTGRIQLWDVGAQRTGHASVGRPYPHAIAIDANDVVWFSELRTGSIVSFDPATEQLMRHRIPWTFPGSSNIQGIAIDAVGSVWFADPVNNKLGKLD